MSPQFYRPQTMREALSLKRKFKDRAAFLGGGTFLNAKDSTLHPEHLISLEGLGLDRCDRKDGDIVIGATCTLERLIEERKIPAPLKAAASQVVSRNIRNVATIGGHIARNPAISDLLPMLVALDARVGYTASGAARTAPLLDYLLSGEEGLITRVIIPFGYGRRAAACGNVRASANASSLLSAAVSMTCGRTGVKDPVIALSGSARQVVRLTPVEAAIHGGPLPSLDEIAGLVRRCIRPGATRFASAAYREHQAGELVALTLHKALREKGGRA